MSNWFTNTFNRPAVKAQLPIKAKTPDPGAQVMGGFLYRTVGRVFSSALQRRNKGWVYVCIEKIANAVSSLDWTFLEQKGYDSTGLAKTAPLDRNHWLVQLFENPSGTGPNALEWITWQEIMKMLVRWRRIERAAYLWTPDGTDNGTGKYPVQMWWLPASLVTPIGGKDSIVDHYELQTGRGIKILSRREVAYLPMLGINGEAEQTTLFDTYVQGYSPSEATADAIDADEATIQFIADHYRNGAMPPIVFEASNPQTDEFPDPESFMRKWHQKFQGANAPRGDNVAGWFSAVLSGVKRGLRKREQVGILPVGWQSKVIDLVNNLKNMMGIADKTMEMIAQAFGVPVSMLKGNAANFATARVDNYIFRIDTVEPEAYTLEAVLTRHFRKYDPNVMVKHIPAIDEDPEQLRADEDHLIKHGALTRNELREKRGLKTIKDDEYGDTFFGDKTRLPFELLGQGGDSILKAAGASKIPIPEVQLDGQESVASPAELTAEAAADGAASTEGAPVSPEQSPVVGGNDLRASVGGSAQVGQIQQAFYGGKMPREAAIANLMMLFGFTEEEANKLLPEEEPETLPTVESIGADPLAALPTKSVKAWTDADITAYLATLPEEIN